MQDPRGSRGHGACAARVRTVPRSSRRCVALLPQVNAVWAPDGRHILVTADFQLHVTVWSLVSQARACTAAAAQQRVQPLLLPHEWRRPRPRRTAVLCRPRT